MDELEELVYYITEMKRSFNRKLDDHLFIIQQQNNKIDEQSQIIEELSWQFRDLRDSVRQISHKPSQCKCNYENHVPSRSPTRKDSNKTMVTAASGLKLSLPASTGHTSDAMEDDIYEPIEFPQRNWQPQSGHQSAPVGPSKTATSKLPTKSAKNMKIPSIRIDNTSDNSFTKTPQSPRPNSTGTSTIRRSKDVSHSEKFKRNSLESKRISNGSSTSSSISNREQKNETERTAGSDHQGEPPNHMNKFNFEIDDDYEDVILRSKTVKTFGRNSQRGSSKALCSLMSDIEEEYLPQSLQFTENDLKHVRAGSRLGVEANVPANKFKG